MKISTRRVKRLAAITPAFAVALAAAVSPSALAQVNLNSGVESAKGEGTPSDLFGQGGMFETISNVLLFIIGAVAVIMLIVGGIRYTVSGGDQNAVTAAKNTILYAIVGIIVAILAYAVVRWVITSFSNQ